MKMRNKDYKLSKKNTLLSSLCAVLLLAVFHNFTIMSFYTFPEPSKDDRLSSLVIQNEINNDLKYDLFDRINENAVLNSFLRICRTYYQDKNIILSQNLIKRDILEKAGFRNIKYLKKEDLEKKYAENLLRNASKSIWYNPIVFNGNSYRKIGRYPLSTEPVFKRDYPKMILFIKNENEEQEINAEICERYVVFYPASFFRNSKGGQK